VIRLWNRVGWYRLVAVLLLVGAVGGGIAVAADRQTQHPAVASQNTPTAADRERDLKEVADLEATRMDAERAARRDAQRKADEAAVAAAQQAKSTVAPTTKQSATKQPAGPPGKPVNIPASCAEFTGNRGIGCAVMLEAGFGLDQWPCLDKLFQKESGWNTRASNPSGAYGIPQALPGSKMASAGADWRDGAATQVRWGLGYIRDRYQTPCGAWAHSQHTGWY
jgi:hypothetical protein